MKIEIADRLQFFSHTPGQHLMIPGTNWSIKAYPTALVFIDEEKNEKELSFDLKGPFTDFTVEQNLHSRQIKVYGQSYLGYFRLSVSVHNGLMLLQFEKIPENGILLDGKLFQTGDVFEVARGIIAYEKSFEEKLFLGSSKSKELDSIRRRKDLREIFPHWYCLGNITPGNPRNISSTLEKQIEKKDKKSIYDLFYQAYLAHFSTGLVPREKDEEKQGIFISQEFADELLVKGSQGIRALFFQEKEDGLHILPCLLPLFVCGKLLQIKTQGGCVIDLEWTKHKIRRMKISVGKEQVLRLHFQNEIQCFRLKTSHKDKGKVVSAKQVDLPVKVGDVLFLDRFQK